MTKSIGSVLALSAVLAGCCCRPRAVPVASGRAEKHVFLDAFVVRVSDADAAWFAKGPRTLSSEERERLIRELRAKGVDVIATPKVLALDGQRATVFVGENVGAGGADWNGFTLETTPTVVGTGVVRLDMTARVREGAPNAPSQAEASAVAEVAAGDSLLLGTTDGNAPWRLVVVATPTVLAGGK